MDIGIELNELCSEDFSSELSSSEEEESFSESSESMLESPRTQKDPGMLVIDLTGPTTEIYHVHEHHHVHDHQNGFYTYRYNNNYQTSNLEFPASKVFTRKTKKRPIEESFSNEEFQECPYCVLPEIHYKERWTLYFCSVNCPGHGKVLIRRKGQLHQHHWITQHTRTRKGRKESVRPHYRLTKNK